ncbi:MAG: type II toxin-antitoxin system BrnA family antitoxin [Legionellales bacterium]
MKASDFDKKFDSGEDITDSLELAKAKRPGLQVKRINVDLPEWMIQSLDKEAHRIGTTRQSLIKFWVADKLDHHRSQ